MKFVSDRLEDSSIRTTDKISPMPDEFRRTLISLAFALSWRRAPAQASKQCVRVTISDLAFASFVTNYEFNPTCRPVIQNVMRLECANVFEAIQRG